jgi:hypothetical protein
MTSSQQPTLKANRTVLEGQKIEIWVDKGRWFLGRAPREVENPRSANI